MEREKIRESLDTVARERGAGKRDLWPGVEGRVRAGERQKSVARGEWMPLPGGSGARRGGFNFGLAGVMTLLLLGIGGLALMLGLASSNRAGGVDIPVVAATATPRPTINIPPEDISWGFEGHDNIYKLSSYVGITETRGGYAVTLDRAYADANGIVVFYSTQRVNGVRLNDIEVELSLPDGSTVASYPYNVKQHRTRDWHIVLFDSAALTTLPDKLSVEFRLDALAADKYAAAYPTVTAASKSYEESRARWRAMSTEFEFTFEVPVTKAGTRVMELNQSVEANGETLTLERVVITPVEFRAILRYGMSDEDSGKYIWQTSSWLQTGDPMFDSKQQVPPMGYSYEYKGEGRGYAIIWPFADMSGDWTLNVYDIKLNPNLSLDGTSGLVPKSIRGPWEFKFTVPPSER